MDFLIILGVVSYLGIFIFGFKWYIDVRYHASELEIASVTILGVALLFYGAIKIGQALSNYLV
jgi:hypothetical protein